jgi:hypothetical protein
MSALTPDDIAPGVVITNGRGRYRMVTNFEKVGAWSGFRYDGAYVNTRGKMKPAAPGFSGMQSLLAWSTRLATPGERADVIRTLNPKGIE